MTCEHFGTCGSCSLYEDKYEDQVKNKALIAQEKFSLDIPLEIHKSKDKHFRNRSEFRIFHHKEGSISYAMHTIDRKIVTIKSCPIVHSCIYKIMPILIEKISQDKTLKQRLFAIEFLSDNIEKEMIVTMIYHKKLSPQWEEVAKKLQEDIGIFIVGRSRKQKIILNKDYIQENLQINNKTYILNYYEASFTQPNTNVNEQMISFVKNNTKETNGDLLELYCGCGNFTIALSENFNKVLATEISKKSIYAARQNTQINNVNNISFTRLSVEELVSALNKERSFKRLKDIDLSSFNFKTVLVDPPRAGLDDITIEFIKKFENIVYISCNIDTLKNNIDELDSTHKITKWAIFDQFAYTKHLEIGMILKKKSAYK